MSTKMGQQMKLTYCTTFSLMKLRTQWEEHENSERNSLEPR